MDKLIILNHLLSPPKKLLSLPFLSLTFEHMEYSSNVFVN